MISGNHGQVDGLAAAADDRVAPGSVFHRAIANVALLVGFVLA
jgi:hypothetical protein